MFYKKHPKSQANYHSEHPLCVCLSVYTYKLAILKWRLETCKHLCHHGYLLRKKELPSPQFTLRWICPKGKREWVLVGLLTFVFLITQVFPRLCGRGTAFISKCCSPPATMGRKSAQQLEKDFKLKHGKTTLNTCTLLFYQASGLPLPVVSSASLLPQKKGKLITQSKED